MKQLLLCMVAFCAIQTIKSQTTYTAEFSDGEEKEITLVYDDPNFLSPFRMGMAIGMDVPKEAVIGLILHPQYRYNERIHLEAIFRAPISRSSDGNITQYLEDNEMVKTFRNLRVLGHYDLFSRYKERTKKLAVDWSGGSNGGTVYMIKVPRVHYKAIAFDLGLNTNRVAYDMSMVAKDPMVHTGGYNMVNHRSTSIQAGFSHFKSESYKISTNGVDRSYFRMRRWYANIIYSVSQSADYQSVTSDSQGNRVVKELSDENILIQPTVESLGWVVGLSKHLGFKNTGLSGWFGIEVGSMPFMSNEGFKKEKNERTPSTLFSMHFGLAFGPRPVK